MNRLPRSRPLGLLAALLALAATPVQAQLYRYVGPDGRTVFADSVPPDARQVERIAPEDTVSPTQAAAQRRRVEQEQAQEKAEEQAELERSAQRRAQFDAAYDALQAAKADLEAARQRLQDGAEPLPGERIGNRGGGTRLRESYFQRQAQLKADAQEAERRVEALQAQTRDLE